MPYKSTSKINIISKHISLSILILISFLTLSSPQSQCAKRPLPANISLKANESIIINLDEYFDGTNLTFIVQPNNSYSSIEPAYQCNPVGNQRVGKIIHSKYFLHEDKEVLAILAESPFAIGTFTFYIYQINQSKLTTINLPKENIELCTHFDIKMINQTHFSPTIDCNYTAKNWSRALMIAVGQIGSPYADWVQIVAPIYARLAPKVRLIISNDILIRGIFSATNSYIQVWLWSEQARQIVGILDKTFLSLKIFNLKSIKLYGSLLIALDYQSGLHLFRILTSKRLEIVGFISSPFYQEFEYNALTGMLYLSKKGKMVSALLNPYSLSLVIAGESYNIYKYEDIRKILISDSTVVALGDSALNIFRVTTDRRHYSLYLINNIHTIYARMKTQGFTVLLLQNVATNLQIFSCRIRPPYLKLSTPFNSIKTSVIATSVLDRQQSICTQNFTFQYDDSSIQEIYDNGYNIDNETIYGNQQGQGLIDLSKYGMGRNLAYSLRTIKDTILQSSTKIKKSLPHNCSFIGKPILTGGKIGFIQSWQNIVVIQFTIDKSLRYYACTQDSCRYVEDIYRLQPIRLMAHETIFKSKIQSEILQVFLQQTDAKITLIVNKLFIFADELSIYQQFCQISLEGNSTQMWKVQQIQINNGLLYVVIPLRKEIQIYDLRHDECPNVLNLNTKTCQWGYFAPRSIHFNQGKSVFPSQTFLIRQWDELLTVKLQKQTSLIPYLLTKNTLPLVVNYTIILTFPYLLAFDFEENKIFTYQFNDQNSIQYLRQVPLQGKIFKSSSSITNEFAKLLESKHIALILEDPQTKIKFTNIFKIDQLISGAMQYQTYPVKAEEVPIWVFVEEEWFFYRLSLVNFSVIAELTCQGNATFLNPTAQLYFGRTVSAYDEYSQSVSLVISTQDKIQLHSFKISLSNIGDSIKRGINFPSRGDSIEAKQVITIDDKKWFSGSIFDYQFQCSDCGQRIIFKQKVTMEDREAISLPQNKFWLQGQGKTIKILMGAFLVELQANYSVDPYFQQQNNRTNGIYTLLRTTPLTTAGSNCIEAIPTRRQFQTIALCERIYEDNSRSFYLSLVSTASYKTFIIAETLLNFDIESSPRMIVKNDIIIVYTSQIAYIMTLWQIQQRIQFIQLDQIDHQDINSKICSIDLTFNTTLSNATLTQILFSIIVTQTSSNIYFTSFIIYMEKDEFIDENGNVQMTVIPNLHVNSAQNINLMAKFSQSHIQIPSEAVAVQTIATRSINEDELTILAVFDKFHTYQFILFLSKSGVAYNMSISKVFYKYSNYEAVSAEIGHYLAIKYRSKLLGREERYGFFDINGVPDSIHSVKEYYMFSGYSLQNSGESGQEIPWMYQGKTLIHFSGGYLELLNITHLLIADIKRLDADGQSNQNDVLYSQKIQITANNIASARSAIIVLKAVDKIELTGWQIALIIIGSILLVIGTAAAIRYGVKKYRSYKKMVPLLEDSQLEDADLQGEEQQRMSDRINMSVRDSVEPV